MRDKTSPTARPIQDHRVSLRIPTGDGVEPIHDALYRYWYGLASDQKRQRFLLRIATLGFRLEQALERGEVAALGGLVPGAGVQTDTPGAPGDLGALIRTALRDELEPLRAAIEAGGFAVKPEGERAPKPQLKSPAEAFRGYETA